MSRLHLYRLAALIPTCIFAGWMSSNLIESAVAATLIGITAFAYRETTRRERALRDEDTIERIRELTEQPYGAVYDLAADIRAEIKEIR